MADVKAAPDATASANLLWAERLVQGLIQRGVRDACVSPGSRSAPLALALHRSGIRTHVSIDERAGGFFALGLAKASRRPVAIVTTSGTAAANLLPALVEAYHGRVPLVAMTADRPPELRDTGAAQTIDQIKIFAGAVRWFHEVGAPSLEPDLSDYAASIGARAAAEACGPPAGPVHLNLAFREPLIPDPDPLESVVGGPGTGFHDRSDPEPRPEPPFPAPRLIERIAAIVRSNRRGLILCGPDDSSTEFPEAVGRLAQVTGYPILADPVSQIRYGPHDRSRVHGAYDLFLRSPRFASRSAPEVVLQFGAALTSKSYHLYAARHPRAIHLLVDPAGGWRNPLRSAREVLRVDPGAFAHALAEALRKGADPYPGWGDSFAKAEAAARAAIRSHLEGAPGLGEEAVFPALLEGSPDACLLYVGNSMAVRDLDLSTPTSAKEIRVLANRGANGIDGVLSSGLGASVGSDSPVLIVTGDLSFHHDLNGLGALQGGARATIVVVNNDGGGIFSFLPVRSHEEVFERYFGTPHGLDLERAAALYGVPFDRCHSSDELRSRAGRSLRNREPHILEVRTDREENRARHQELWARAVRLVEEAL
jgi:2-succinyl-5-enolpyruvyl-6-hydroxy-3-cyclohexene-1-carboxylate synthase